MPIRQLLPYLTILIIFLVQSGICEITRYPHVLPTADMEHSVMITWRTQNQAGGTVYFGTSYLAQSADAVLCTKRKNEQSLRPKIETRNGQYQYYAVLANLSPGTQYRYKVVSDNTETEICKFTTSSTDNDFSFRVVLLADPHWHSDTVSDQTQDGQYLPLIRAYDPHLVFILGDIAYGQNEVLANEWEYEAGHWVWKDILANAIYVPTCAGIMTAS